MEIRKMKQNGTCRGCGADLKKDVDVVFHTYHMVNRGTHVFLCCKCVEDLWIMYNDYWSGVKFKQQKE